MKQKRLMLVGGGTGGHITPILAVASALKKKDPNLVIKYVGSTKKLDRQLALEAGLDFWPLVAGKWRRYWDWRNLIDIFKLLISFIQSVSYLLIFRPNLVFIKGGYIGLMFGLACRLLNVPYVVHESDVIMGMANRFLASWAKRVFLSWPMDLFLPLNRGLNPDKLLLTGLPVRPEFKQPVIHKEDRPTLMILGGSQGAHRINELIQPLLPELSQRYKIYHQTGDYDWHIFKNQVYDNYEAFPFRSDIADLLASADLVISRAGATSILEIAICAKPLILLPLMGSANRHQEANALALEQKQAAIVLIEPLTSSQLLQVIENTLEDKEKSKELADNLYHLAKPDADKEIADVLIAIMGVS